MNRSKHWWTGLAVVCIALGLAGQARADESFSPANVAQWAGTGASSAYLVVDFGLQQYTFGLHFDQATTGWDMLTELNDQTDLTVEYQQFSWGDFVTGFAYAGHHDNGAGWNGNDYWGYWISPDGTNWTSPAFGAADRQLANGDWDGYTWTETVGTNPPGTLVPEPVSLALLGTGLLGLRRRRR